MPTAHPATLPPVQFDAALIKKLSQQGPRYTSYPTADRFTDAFRAGDYLQAVSNVRAMGSRKPISLYLHIPFCESLCYYCGCNKIITKNHGKADTYLTYLKREIDMQSKLLTGMNRVEQLHFGGGTPAMRKANTRSRSTRVPSMQRACIRCAPRASIVSASACRTSIPMCRRRSIASSRKS